MASGPEHYREAERLLEYGPHDEQEPERVLRDFAEAQVHATLALAAATAMGAPAGAQTNADRRTWLDAASAHVKPGGAA